MVSLAICSPTISLAAPPAPRKVLLSSQDVVTKEIRSRLGGKKVLCLFVPTTTGLTAYPGFPVKKKSDSWWLNISQLKGAKKPTRKARKLLKQACTAMIAQLDQPSPQLPGEPLPTPTTPSGPGGNDGIPAGDAPPSNTGAPAPLPGFPTPQPGSPSLHQCNDGIDNDEDGLVDTEEDPGCSSDSHFENIEGEPRASEVTQWGVTFQFDKEYRVGKFANGDYWVAPELPGGFVTITDILPEAAAGRNGWQVNPSPKLNPGQQAFDSRANLYQSALKPALPYAAKAGDSIVKAVSETTDCGPPLPVSVQCLASSAVLTVLDSVPIQRGAIYFRPAYVRGDKSLISINNLHGELLPSLAPPPDVAIPTLAELVEQIRPPNLDHGFVHDARARAKPSPWYGAEISRRNSEILLRLFLNDPLEDKKPLLIGFVNYGLDLFAMLQENHHWDAAGGHGHGRASAIAFAGVMLERDDIITALTTAPTWKFGETDATYISPVTGEALYGESNSGCTEDNYWLAIKAPTGYNACRDPYPATPAGQPGGSIDGSRFPGGPGGYQTCCSSGHWQSTFSALEIMPALKSAWYPTAFTQYVKRFLQKGVSTAQDTCAPARGVCEGGANGGAVCTTANASLVCTGSGAKCAIDMSQYKITFGPDEDNPGNCIQDTDPTDGIGRFPQQDGSNNPFTWGQTPFQVKMRETYLNIE